MGEKMFIEKENDFIGIEEIENELNLSDNGNKIKNKIKLNKTKKRELLSFNYKDFQILVGRNNKENEEIYIITEGKGTLTIDGEVVKIEKGNVIKISPNGKRQFAAADDEGISYVCVQVKENSLTSYTENDAIIY